MLATVVISRLRGYTELLPASAAIAVYKLGTHSPWRLESAIVVNPHDLHETLWVMANIRAKHQYARQTHTCQITEGSYTDLHFPALCGEVKGERGLGIPRRSVLALILKALSRGFNIWVYPKEGVG